MVDAKLSCILYIALGVAGPPWDSKVLHRTSYENRQFEVVILNEVRAEGVCAVVDKLTLKQLKDCKHQEQAFHFL